MMECLCPRVAKPEGPTCQLTLLWIDAMCDRVCVEGFLYMCFITGHGDREGARLQTVP